MLLATYLKIAIFALATVPVGFARPLTSGSGGANTDLQFRDEQIDTRELVVDDIYGRDLADDYASARELNDEAQELELRQWAAIGTWTLCLLFYSTYSIYSTLCSQGCPQTRRQTRRQTGCIKQQQ